MALYMAVKRLIEKMEQEVILQVRDLQYAYSDEKMALKGVDLDIRQGERIAVMGSNGAGKSTFFLNINGVLQSEHGEIFYRGQKMTKKTMNGLRKNVGIVFQDADSQIIASTVQSEVSFGPMNLKLSRNDVRDRVDEALSYMNLTDFRHRPPHYLSGGEKKRVSIADIIAMHPEIIIFDEPTAALDPVNADMLEEVLEKMAQEGKTIMISTHDVDFAYRWAERVVVFCDGKIIADDAPLAVFSNETVIRQANLKRPMMLDIFETMREKGLVKDDRSYPKNVEEFKYCI